MITNFDNFSVNEASNTAKSTNLIKKYLKSKYNINAKVSSKFYSGGSSLRVSYIGGVDKNIVEADLSRLEYGRFDGMEDIYNYKNDAEVGIRLDNTDLETYKYVFIEQEITNDLEFRLAKMYSEYLRLEGAHIIETEDDYRRDFPKLTYGAWNWRNLLYRNFEVRNFVTDDLDNINLIKCGESTGNRIYFEYEYKGKTYRTDKFEKISDSTVEAPKRERASVLNNVKLIDYSERAVAVIGNTYEIKDKLKELGGKFNKFLKVDNQTVSGWIFPKSKESMIADVLVDYL